MRTLEELILNQEQISDQLEPNEGERNQYLKIMADFTNQFINQIHDNPAFSLDKVNAEPFRITGKPQLLEDLLSIYSENVIKKGLIPSSGGHIGYIPGGGLFLSALGDYLADISNEYAGLYFGSPGAVSMENALLNWLKSIFHFPESSLGNLTSGGSIANLIALTAARDYLKMKGDQISKHVVYLSPQTHHCIQKSLRIIGLEDVQLRYLNLDANFKIDVNLLETEIKNDIQSGNIPSIVIASAGTTDTGVVDPLNEIGMLAQKHRLWYHIDGAYGGFFILTESKKHLFQGIEMADSLVIDPHKGLFLPYGTGAVLIKHKEAVFHSHHYTASYLQDAMLDEFPVSPADTGPELTKHFRGLRMWLPLQVHGITPFIACLNEKLLLTQYFRRELIKLGFNVGPEPDLSVSYFWYPFGKDENAFNKRLMEKIHQDGRVFLSSTTLNGKFVIRMAILSFRTKKKTIDKSLKMIEEILENLKDEGFY